MITVAIKWNGIVPAAEIVQKEALRGFPFDSRTQVFDARGPESFIYITGEGLKEMVVAVHAVCAHLRERCGITPDIWVEGNSLLTYAAQQEAQARRRGIVIANAATTLRKVRSVFGAGKQRIAVLRADLEAEACRGYRDDAVADMPAIEES